MTKPETLFEISQSELVFEGRKELAHIRDNLHHEMRFALKPDKALIASIAEMGVLQPILIERKDNLRYVIRAGKRRFLAAEMADQKDIPCVIKSFPLGMGAKAALDTNIKRSRNPVDEYNQLIEFEQAFSDQREIPSDKRLSAMLGISIPALRKMRCVETMPSPVQKGINEKRITVNNAYKLANLPPSRQKDLIEALREGDKVTGNDIKAQKRVLFDEAKEATLSLEVPEGRSDIPRLSVIRDATKIRFSKLTQKAQGEIADFTYAILTAPTQTLDKILGEKENE